ncbi:MAG: alpha-mannosidase [Promethearchaeota archaeon]
MEREKIGLIKDFFPVFRRRGIYSGNPRDLEKEFMELQEPDIDNPEAWLKEERHEPEFKKYVKINFEYIWRDVDFNEAEYYIGGQSHIDVAWKWRYWQTLRKVIVTYRKAVWHVKNHPKFTFVSSQPLLLEWIKKEDPELFEDIKAAVKTGRFDLCGGMWVEPDCHMPSGESFVRQRLYGQLFYLENFGRISEVEWVPDSFGYTRTLPQIFLKSGTPFFYTTKLANNSYSQFPFVNFFWESPDGSRVLTMINPGGFGSLSKHRKFNPRRRLLIPGKKLVADYEMDRPEDLDVFSEELAPIPIFTGKGDGGHGPTGMEVAVMDKLVEEKGIKWITATEFFKKKLDPLADRLPTWRDELYYEFHRGTLTTQDLVKRMNRYFEWRLNTVESLLTLASIIKGAGVKGEVMDSIRRTWKLTLINQFHDVLPGSSIPEVYDDVYDFWEYARKLLDGVEKTAWALLLDGKQKAGNKDLPRFILLYNGTGFDATGFPVEVAWPDGLDVPSAAKIGGNTSPIQLCPADKLDLDENFVKRPRRLLFKANVPQHGFILVELLKTAEKTTKGTATSVSESENNITLENKHYRILIDKKAGNIKSVVFKDIDKEVISDPGIDIKVFYDWLPSEPCWNILPGYREMELEQSRPQRIEIVEKGPVRWTVEIEREIKNEESEAKANGTSTMIQRISILDNMPGIYLEFLVDWHTCDATVKVDVETTTNADYSVSEVPYGTTRRSTRPTANHDVPRWENYHHGWVDLESRDEKWGIAFINKGKYGFDVKKGRIGLTLIRGPRYPRPSGEAWVNMERNDRARQSGEAPPTHADQGTHLIQYIILPHEGKWNDTPPKGGTSVQALTRWFNEGCCSTLVYSEDTKNENWTAESLIASDNVGAEVPVIKSAEDGDGYVMRIVETTCKNRTEKVQISPTLKFTECSEVDLLERPINDKKKNTNNKDVKITRNESGIITAIELSLKPHEIKTLRFK